MKVLTGQTSGVPLGPEYMYAAYNVLPADGTLVHLFTAGGTGHHMAALQEDTVDGGIHTDSAEILFRRQHSRICGEK